MRASIEKKYKDDSSKFRSVCTDLRMMEQGQFTLKSFFKSKEAKEQLIV